MLQKMWQVTLRKMSQGLPLGQLRGRLPRQGPGASSDLPLLSLPRGAASGRQGRKRQGETLQQGIGGWPVRPDGFPATARGSLMTQVRPTQRPRTARPDATGPNRP